MPAGEPASPSARRRLAAAFVAAGGLALTAQIVLLRELLVALQGDETAIALGLGAWLAGITAGATAARRLVLPLPEAAGGSRDAAPPTAPRPPGFPPGACASWGLALLAIAAPAGVLAGRFGRLVLAPPAGEVPGLGAAAALALLVLAPAGAFVGLSFAALAVASPLGGWRPGTGIARLYVLEAGGSLLGGLAATFVWIPRLPPLPGALLASGAWLLVASLGAGRGLLRGRAALIGIALLLVVAAPPPVCGGLDAAAVRARFDGLAPGIPLLAWGDTPYQHVAIGGGEQRHLYLGGQYAGSFPDPADAEAQAHLLASLAARPASVLLIGAGWTSVVRFLLEHPIDRLDIVEIDRRAMRLVERYLPPEDDAALSDPRVTIVADDPRRFLAAAAGSEPYDLILILEPSPVTLLLARLSTAEFYALCAACLAPDGALVVRLETAPNVLTGETAALGGAVWGALRQSFPVVRATPGPDGYLVAGARAAAVTLDPGVLAARLRERRIASDVFVPQTFRLLLSPERVRTQEAALAAAAGKTAPSRDDRPVSFQHALARRAQEGGSLLAPLLGWAGRRAPAWLALLALAPSLLGIARAAFSLDRGRAAPRAAIHAIAVTGACGMAWSLLLLLSYQTRAGALYGRIGLMAAAFMLGLALGGLAATRAAEVERDRAVRRLTAATAGLLGFALLFPFTLSLLAAAPLAVEHVGLTEILHAVLQAIAGLATGTLFPAAAGVLLPSAGPRSTASRLEAADHLGAALAALCAGILLIPALGLSGTAWLLAALQAIALARIVLARARSAAR